MYLIFYVSGLAHLHDADRVVSSFLPGWRALSIVGAVLVTGAVGIPLRFYLLSAVAFDFRKLGGTFGRLFPFVLALDQLWAIAPFLLLPQIGVAWRSPRLPLCSMCLFRRELWCAWPIRWRIEV